MQSLEIRIFTQNIINYTNASPLPIEAKRLAIMEILRQVNNEADRVIQNELEERKKQQAEKAGQGNSDNEPEQEDKKDGN